MLHPSLRTLLRACLRAAAWLAAAAAVLAAALFLYARGYQFDAVAPANRNATPASLPYLQQAAPQRGHILIVVSSTSHFPGGVKKAGYELTELSRAYYVFRANGFEVDIASPRGCEPFARIDHDDMGDADYAFLNDPAAQRKVNASLALAQVDPARYAAVYFAGGKGAMFDFPANPEVARIAGAIAAHGVVGAVCHGPAALLDVLLADGTPLVAGRRMTGFSNAEELLLMKDARQRFPWLLEDQARARGARFTAGPLFVDTTVVDGRLVTGQNPWSTWSVAEAMVMALGHTPAPRPRTAEEYSVHILAAFHTNGWDAARAAQQQAPQYDRSLLLLHALVAAMDWRLGDALQLQWLARY